MSLTFALSPRHAARIDLLVEVPRDLIGPVLRRLALPPRVWPIRQIVQPVEHAAPLAVEAEHDQHPITIELGLLEVPLGVGTAKAELSADRAQH